VRHEEQNIVSLDASRHSEQSPSQPTSQPFLFLNDTVGKTDERTNLRYIKFIVVVIQLFETSGNN
jgi:hypothetical protein